MIRAINGFLPNGTLLNTNACFSQATTPLTRIDGSPLIGGDRLYRTDLGINYIRNASISRWLSENVQTQNLSFGFADITATTRAQTVHFLNQTIHDFYLVSFDSTGYVGVGNLSGVNYWQATFANNSSILYTNNVVAKNDGSTHLYIKADGAINNALITVSTGTALNVSFVKVGSAPNFGASSIAVHYRLALK